MTPERLRDDIAHAHHMRNAEPMGKMLQVRNVPERLHRELRRRAKGLGLTLTDYVQSVLEREVARPPADEVFDRIDSRPSVELDIRIADIVRGERPPDPT